MSSLNVQEICEGGTEHFRSTRYEKRKDIDTNLIVTDFTSVDKFRAFAIHDFIPAQITNQSTTSGESTPNLIDPRIRKLKEEWKYCSYIQKQYDYTCCVKIGFFRLKLQNVFVSLPFHALISLLVIIDVLLIILEITIETRQLALCRNDADCNPLCNYTRLPTTFEKNESENIVCGFVGLMHKCVTENDVTINVSRILSIISITILSIFFFEILFKFFAFGFRIFTKCFEVFDSVIVIISLLIDVAHFISEENEVLIIFELLIIFRLWRIVRIITTSIIAYNTIKEEKKTTQCIQEYPQIGKIYFELLKEYELAKSEIIRIREILVSMEVNPFPTEYILQKDGAISMDTKVN